MDLTLTMSTVGTGQLGGDFYIRSINAVSHHILILSFMLKYHVMNVVNVHKDKHATVIFNSLTDSK